MQLQKASQSFAKTASPHRQCAKAVRPTHRVHPKVVTHALHGQQDRPSTSSPLLAAAAAAILMLSPAGNAQAISSEKVAEFGASGLVFKDSVEVTYIDDPEIEGVTLYISDFKRSLADKLAKNFFDEPSQASISCALTGPVSLRQGSISKIEGGEGQELFSESKGFNLFKNKTLRIRRIYDEKHNAVIYVAYSTRLTTAADDGKVSSGRYRTSMCAVPLPASILTPPGTNPADN